MTWLKNLLARIPEKTRLWIGRLLIWLVMVGVGALLASLGLPKPDIGPIPLPEFEQRAMGWIDDPEAVVKALGDIEKKQGFAPYFARFAQAAAEQDNNEPVFLWDAETKVLGKTLGSWDQGNIGSCVANGWGRAVQDLALVQIAGGAPEKWAGAEVCREAIYGGSRVQVGGGRIRGDGSVGAWAAKWVQEDSGGTLFYLPYPGHDLTSGYSVQRCRQWGDRGCPKELIPIAREHPVKGVALVTTADECWTALGSGYPIPVCSGVGFQSPLRDGFCVRRGSWAHCMEVRGRFMHPTKGRCFVIQNSWGDYLRSTDANAMIDVQGRGKVRIPEGCFAITASEMQAIAREKDSFAVSAFKGFPGRKPNDWIIRANPAPERREPVFALAW